MRGWLSEGFLAPLLLFSVIVAVVVMAMGDSSVEYSICLFAVVQLLAIFLSFFQGDRTFEDPTSL